jgi:hypothetical protein
VEGWSKRRACWGVCRGQVDVKSGEAVELGFGKGFCEAGIKGGANGSVVRAPEVVEGSVR